MSLPAETKSEAGSSSVSVKVKGSQPVFSQSSQHRETDLQIVARMNQQAAQMSTSGNDQVVTGRVTSSEEADMRRLHRELAGIQSQIRQEQKRLKTRNFDEQKNIKGQQQRMQKLDSRLRRLQTEIVALN